MRKYFEVPGCNTLLIAKKTGDLKELGLIGGENYVECDDYNLYHLAMHYLDSDEERNSIASNGYQLVHSRHTDSIRVKEFTDTIKPFIEQGR